MTRWFWHRCYSQLFPQSVCSTSSEAFFSTSYQLRSSKNSVVKLVSTYKSTTHHILGGILLGHERSRGWYFAVWEKGPWAPSLPMSSKLAAWQMGWFCRPRYNWWHLWWLNCNENNHNKEKAKCQNNTSKTLSRRSLLKITMYTANLFDNILFMSIVMSTKF